MPDPAPPPTPERDAELLRQFLAGRDTPCACGYNLRDLTTQKCPECGETLHPTIEIRSRRMAYWLVTLFGGVVGVTFSAAIGGVALHMRFVLGDWPPIEPLLPVVIGGLLMCGATVITWTSRAQVHRVRYGTVQSAAIGIWAATVAIIVLTYALM